MQPESLFNTKAKSVLASLIAIIEIGSASVRLLVVRAKSDGSFEERDCAHRALPIGREVFTSGFVSRNSIIEVCCILKNFAELLKAWEIQPQKTLVIAGSALWVAKNREIIVDRVAGETGFRLKILDGIEENKLSYTAFRAFLGGGTQSRALWQGRSMILDVGGGSTEIMLLNDGKMVAAHSIRLGTIQVDQQARRASLPRRFLERYLNDKVRYISSRFNAEMAIDQIDACAFSGSDMQRVASLLGEKNAADNIGDAANIENAANNIGDNANINDKPAQYTRIPRSRFCAFTREVKDYTVENVVSKLGVHYSEAEGFIPGILIYAKFLELTQAAEFLVPHFSIREAYLLDFIRRHGTAEVPGIGANTAAETRDAVFFAFQEQIIASAYNLGRKFSFDENHARYVAEKALFIFDELAATHRLGGGERLLLHITAILHDIGGFINEAHHNKHGYYIVSNSDLFALSAGDKRVVAVAVLFHQKHNPTELDSEYAALSSGERMLLLKLLAILRTADCLDRGHTQSIQLLAVEQKSDHIILRTKGGVDLSLEQMELDEKSSLFQSVLGYNVALI